MEITLLSARKIAEMAKNLLTEVKFEGDKPKYFGITLHAPVRPSIFEVSEIEIPRYNLSDYELSDYKGCSATFFFEYFKDGSLKFFTHGHHESSFYCYDKEKNYSIFQKRKSDMEAVLWKVQGVYRASLTKKDLVERTKKFQDWISNSSSQVDEELKNLYECIGNREEIIEEKGVYISYDGLSTYMIQVEVPEDLCFEHEAKQFFMYEYNDVYDLDIKININEK